jgi:AbrB family looped-hinge helix DNA binding protein
MRKRPFDAIAGIRGQITVPAAVRRDLGLKTGDLVDFVKNERGQIVFRPRMGAFPVRKDIEKVAEE